VLSLESTVGIAKIGTKSLRTTVPEGIAVFLGIEIGDKLEWKMDIQNNERVATVRKKENKRD
jgi:bifunctional DNA-binding transcriptional regulator/antitoxin component of YhaV-PrlF toxin-antitoxin module